MEEPLDGISAGRSPPCRRPAADVRVLSGLIWLGGLLFAAAIVALYPISAITGSRDDWNAILSNLHIPGSPVADGAILAHFLLGAFLMCLGPIQLSTGIRTRHPRFHRVTGWLYAAAAFLTGVAGSAFILIRGTIGGVPMTIGFLCYGFLMMIAPVQTVRMAVARRIEDHRAWAIRLYALVIASMLYRADYGLWGIAFHGLWRTKAYGGPFDFFMDFAFFIIPLAIAQTIIRKTSPGSDGASIAVLPVAARWSLVAYLAAGLGLLTVFTWVPIILWRFGAMQ